MILSLKKNDTMTQQNPQSHDGKRLLIALAVATSIMMAWQFFYERPRLEAERAAAIARAAIAEKTVIEKKEAPKLQTATPINAAANAPRIKINSASLHGSISLTGARFDDLKLVNYRETIDKDSPEMTLLHAAESDNAYFAEVGVLGGEEGVAVPNATTQWQTSSKELSETSPVILRWNNGAGLSFEKKIAVDEHYMFTVTTTVKNTGSAAATLYPYGLISRNYPDTVKHYIIMHEGPLGVMNQVLEDINYKELLEDGPRKFTNTLGWLGMTDKYWLTAIMPEAGQTFDASFKHFKRGERDAYQTDMRGAPLTVAVGETTSFTVRLFAGAKRVSLLDSYSAKYLIPLFDRAVDFGSLYFLTKPLFSLLNYFHGLVGNFGLAILLLTVVVKIVLYPLAHKSMVSMARMKFLMPKVEEIKARYGNDKMKMNQEMMALYKREKVNPVAGCLPILLQIPVFLALYRVLFVTIEMRQAPFFGWIHDLSVPDPTNLFTAFGLLPWDAPGFLHLGVWPIVMCATMFIQQRVSPKPADPVQAAVMTYMPFLFLFLFASFPAGLVIYWAWNNTLTIIQQLYINTHLTKKGLR
jgi:YidC/Oxa1 family membrane protein insertase